MKTRNVTILTTIVVLAFLAAGAQGECGTQIFTPEEMGMLSELALGDFCPNQTSSATICAGETMCKSNAGNWKYPTWDADGNPHCPQFYSVTTVGSVDEACDAAEDVAREPSNCPNPGPVYPCQPYCLGGTVTASPQSDNRCCTVTKTRTCMLVPCPKETEELFR